MKLLVELLYQFSVDIPNPVTSQSASVISMKSGASVFSERKYVIVSNVVVVGVIYDSDPMWIESPQFIV